MEIAFDARPVQDETSDREENDQSRPEVTTTAATVPLTGGQGKNKWLIKKGIVTVLATSKRIYQTLEDLYENKYEEPYGGNPNFPGDD